jgi:hypothetical protein
MGNVRARGGGGIDDYRRGHKNFGAFSSSQDSAPREAITRIVPLRRGDTILNVEQQVSEELVQWSFARLTGSMLATAGVNPTHTIDDLQRRLRCRECEAKGRVIVTVFSANARC